MAEKSPIEKSWTDPKDFGLPFVEVKPLKEPLNGLEDVEVVKKIEPAPEPIKEKISSTDRVEADEIKIEATQEIREEPQEYAEQENHKDSFFESLEPRDDKVVDPFRVDHEKAISETPQEPIQPKKSKNWIIYIMIFGLLLASALIWQLMQGGESPISLSEKEETLSQVDSSPSSEEILENTQSEGIQLIENQDDILDSDSLTSESSEISETGTTIEHKEDRMLIRVENRGASPQFFIVVASLPNERIATRESAQYFDKVENVYLILPYEGAVNYRLAIGAFSSYTQAKAELDRIKAEYSEALWILKY